MKPILFKRGTITLERRDDLIVLTVDKDVPVAVKRKERPKSSSPIIHPNLTPRNHSNQGQKWGQKVRHSVATLEGK
jgi:hypothetical protein